VLRILPLYYAVLVVTFLVLAPLQLLPADALRTQHHQVWLWTFLSNWTDPLGFEVKGFAHFWSLAVEEQFYLLWPLVLHRLLPQRVLLLCVGICVAALVFRTAMRVGGYPPEYVYEFTICRMDALALGAAAAALVRLPSWKARLELGSAYLPWGALVVLVSCALLTHDYRRDSWQTQTFGMSALAVAFALLLLAAVVTHTGAPTWLSRALCMAPLRSAGKYSYAMYVFHFPISKLLGTRLLGSAATAHSATIAVLYAAALTVVTYLCACLSYHLYEKHFLRLKRYFVPAHVRLAEAV
jgi:peptidoglycan/LPS O-acetylase OafA/YrhL